MGKLNLQSALGIETATRRYDKGERRFKHVGEGAEPEIKFFSNDPKRWEGKCPNTLKAEDHLRLLNEAIPGDNGDREVDFQKNLFVVNEGAIYKADTTDRGKSYHGYPYHGKLARGLVDKLRKLAIAKNCEKQFDEWVKRHITIHGS